MSATFSADVSDREVESVAAALGGITSTSTAFSDLSAREVEIIAEALKGTTWLALFSRVSKTCRSAAVCVAEGKASLKRLKARDVVCSVELVKWAIDQGCPRDSEGRSISEFAAGEGNLETLKWLRASSFEWDRSTCSAAAKGGHLRVLSGPGPTDASGMSSHVPLQPMEVTWTSLSGQGPTAAFWMRKHVPLQPGEAIWTFSSGRGPMVPLGIREHAPLQPMEATWASSSGRGPTGANGVCTHVNMQPGKVTWTSSSGPGPTHENGTIWHVRSQPREANWTSSSGSGTTGAPGEKDEVSYWATTKGHVDVLEWLEEL